MNKSIIKAIALAMLHEPHVVCLDNKQQETTTQLPILPIFNEDKLKEEQDYKDGRQLRRERRKLNRKK